MISMDPLIGQQLANYRIEKLIGRGGMAKVFLGWDVRLHRSVAVKIIDDRFKDNPNYTERFLREARTMATWQHMNIPLVYHVGEDKGALFFAMEYIQGQNLHRLLHHYTSNGELLPHAEVLRIVEAVAKALDYAHQKGVVHRDVTPANVILSDDGRVVLMDFGLALDMIEGTQGVVFGTPHYIAPEQARSSAMAVRQSDLYSLGVILYEMLTGVTPFDDPSPITLALKHITDDPPPPSKINPAIGPAVEAVVLKALRKKPVERYQSGQEFIAAFEQAVQQDGVESQPVTLAELPEMPDDEPASTLGELPIEQVPAPLPPDELPSTRERKEKLQTPGVSRSRYLALGGVGCGLLILLGFALLVGGISLALSRQGQPTKTEQINAIAITATSTQTRTPTRSLTPRVTPGRTTPSLTPSATTTPTVLVLHELILVSYKDDSLFVVSLGNDPFPLENLEFKNKNGEVSGSEWGVDFLESGDCVTLWKEEGRPKAPKGIECDQVGKKLELSGSEKFWTVQFDVYYQSKKVGICSTYREACSLKIAEIKP